MNDAPPPRHGLETGAGTPHRSNWSAAPAPPPALSGGAPSAMQPQSKTLVSQPRAAKVAQPPPGGGSGGGGGGGGLSEVRATLLPAVVMVAVIERVGRAGRLLR
jgi:hypothetical protein